MRCPRCGKRAVGLVGWIGHTLNQPRWKQNRWQLSCRSCGATLDRSTNDRVLGIALPFIATCASYAVASELPRAYHPYFVVHVVIGIVVGIVLHYPIARYDCFDPVSAER